MTDQDRNSATSGANALEIAPELILDADYIAGASIALLGKRGAGKTYATRVLAESLFDAHVQTVIIDPMGVYWGLRASADGEHDGLPIPVFGGEHGDAPLESSAGALMADLVVEDGLSMVLDLSDFGSRTQERTFATGFFDRLYRRNRDLVHLIVDEADLFGPQKPRREDAHLLVTLENIVRRGRNKGIGITMASQRAAVVNKDILTQVDVLAALRVTAPQDRDAIREWVRGQGDEDIWSDIAPSLPGLANGESWWWLPEKGILKQVQVRQTRTFDSSPTRTRGDSSRAPKTFADVDLGAISDRIAGTIERARSTDPRALTERIRELERALADQQATAPPPSEQVHVAVLDDSEKFRLDQAVESFREIRARTEAATSEALRHLGQMVQKSDEQTRLVVDAVNHVAALLEAAGTTPVSTPPQPDRSPAAAPDDHPERARPAPPVAARSAQDQPPASTPDSGELPPARRRILGALVFLQAVGVAPAGKTQLALWAGVSPRSSGFSNNLGALRTANLITYPTPGHVLLTGVGREVAGPPDTTDTDADLHRKVQKLVSPARWRILSALIETYPEAQSRDTLAAAAGVQATSSGYSNNLGALRTLGLLDYPLPGHVAATDVLFLPRR